MKNKFIPIFPLLDDLNSINTGTADDFGGRGEEIASYLRWRVENWHPSSLHFQKHIEEGIRSLIQDVVAEYHRQALARQIRGQTREGANV
jgi:hypothetical protein